MHAITSSQRKVRQGVPQASDLNPLLLNLAIASLPGAILDVSGLLVHIVTYADDVGLCCVGKSTQAQTICARLQEFLSTVSCRLQWIVLPISLPKTASLLYRLQGRCPYSSLPRLLDAHRTCRAKKHHSIWVSIVMIASAGIRR